MKKKRNKESAIPVPEKKMKMYKDQEEQTDYDMVREASAGVYLRSAYGQLVNYLDKNRMAELLHISSKTLDRYKAANKKLNPQESEIALKLNRLFAMGIKVFGDADEFNSWLKKPSFGLYWKIPNDLLLTSTGIDLVYDEVSRIAYGDLS